jgi:uridine phosphorylase
LERLLDSELILNSDGSIYHLGLKPEHVNPIVITVGDPDRVEAVTKFFDTIDFSIQNREFKTVGGSIGKTKISVISTGIGTDNIDIVLNELAFLIQFDLKDRVKKTNFNPLKIIRLGTSGSVSTSIRIDDLVYSKVAISFDDLFKFYDNDFDTVEFKGRSYEVIPCSDILVKNFQKMKQSITLTAKGFYAPQFRRSALATKYSLADIEQLKYGNEPVGNIEMETAGIYGLSKLLGFEAISINAILADRLSGKFSTNPQKTIDKMIENTLYEICQWK